jgi:UDP-N-acetylmuramate dehydrogenase
MIEDDYYLQDAYLLGGANNVLMSPNPPKLMMLSKQYDYIRIQKGLLVVGAATPSGKVVSFCKKHNIANFEFMAHLPGTIGGMIKMNAGLKEWEIFNHLYSVRIGREWMLKDEIQHGYRFANISDVIFEARFVMTKGFAFERLELFKAMRSNQPKAFSAGSCFKNPPGDYAGRLIEAVGLKGKRRGEMVFSDVHANFLVNEGLGTFEDALFLIQEAEVLVKKKFGIALEREIIVLDND